MAPMDEGTAKSDASLNSLESQVHWQQFVIALAQVSLNAAAMPTTELFAGVVEQALGGGAGGRALAEAIAAGLAYGNSEFAENLTPLDEEDLATAGHIKRFGRSCASG